MTPASSEMLYTIKNNYYETTIQEDTHANANDIPLVR